MKIKFCFIIVMLLCAKCILAQDFFEIKGHVTDRNGNLLIGANIYINDVGIGTVTDTRGAYIIRGLEAGIYTIAVSYIGCEKYQNRYVVESNMTLDFILKNGIILNDLVVTAQKREQSIKDIPTALSSLSTGFIEHSGLTEMSGLADFIPGMQLQIQSPNNPGFVVRGITSDDGASNIEPRVSIFQDGVSISKSRGSVVEIFDMKRIEVLKGPQGTLFGRGAQIGAVHFIQNKAENKKSGSLTLGYGDYNYKTAQGYFNTPLVKNKLFVRLAGIYKEHDGFIRNLSGGRLNGKDTKAIRGSMRFLATKETSFNLIYNYQKDTPPGTAFKSGSYAPKGGDTKAWTFADLDKGKDLGLDRDVWGVTLQGKHFISSAISLNSISAYREFKSNECFDADGTAAPALWFAEESFGKQLSQELRLNLKIGDKFEGFVGGNYFYESGHQKVPFSTDERSYLALISPMLAHSLNPSLVSLGTSLISSKLLLDGTPVLPEKIGDLLSSPLPPLNLLPISVQQQVGALYAVINNPLQSSHSEYYQNFGENSAIEFFADGTYALSDRFKLTAGMRLSMEKIKSSYEAVLGTQPSSLGFARNAGSNVLFMPTKRISEEKSFTSLVGRLALNYSLNSQLDIYTTASRGRRPHVIQFRSIPNNDTYFTSSYKPEILNDETVNSYEIGFKGLVLGSRLYFDLAGYYYQYKDFQTTAIDASSLQIISKDAGNASSHGFECSLKWQLNNCLNIFGNYAYIHAQFDNNDSDSNKQELAGNTFRLTPKNSFALGFHYQAPISDKVDIFIRSSFNYKSKVFFEESNLNTESQSAYGILNLRAGFNLLNKNIQVAIFANNTLNKKYLIDAGNTGRNFGIPTYIAGAPRLCGAELNFKF